jgi:3-deoxy-D-manno-octulosonic-acid transferase
MHSLYNFSIFIYKCLVRIAATFNQKAKLFVDGRKDIFSLIADRTPKDMQPVWFHFASLGEFEQGRPVLEKLKDIQPDTKVVITFFSPSGYEIRKNYPLADAIFYLPLDSPKNARKFIALVNPKMAIFTKYEFWPNYFLQLAEQKIPLYIISGIFRPQQLFFKWYGDFYRTILRQVSYFFVQNEQSLKLLNSIDIQNVMVSGDTRFDRVYENAKKPKPLPVIENFCNKQDTIIVGSSWPEDESILAEILDSLKGWKLIIAPHEIDEAHITSIVKLFPTALRYSEIKSNETVHTESQILIIDNIGMLSSLYSYGKIAYIGGGFGAGIHNTLEAAAFGLPVIFGPNYEKFQEAKDLIDLGAAQSVQNSSELRQALSHFSVGNQSKVAQNYVLNKKGATDVTISHIAKKD